MSSALNLILIKWVAAPFCPSASLQNSNNKLERRDLNGERYVPSNRCLSPTDRIQTKAFTGYLNLRSSEIHLFYNLGDFYWHFLEIVWLFIFLFLYSLYLHVFHILFIFISLAFWPFNDNFIFFIFGKLSPSNGRSITILVVSSCLSLLWNLHLVSLAKVPASRRRDLKTWTPRNRAVEKTV